MAGRREGQEVGRGRFRLRELLGSGGMGEVYLADAADGTRAAVKLIRREYAKNPEFVARFQREAKIARDLRSEHIAALLYYGKIRSGELCIAFEYLEGESLATRLAREGALPMEDVATIVDQVLAALEVAHGAGVIHRDIKPPNVFLEAADRRVKLLDFGVAKRVHGEGEAATVDTAFGATLGSMSYMAPEQIGRSADVDARADLFSTAVVAFRCLAGRLPFVDGSLLGSRTLHDALGLRDVTAKDWPRETEQFFARMLARLPDSRYADATDARRAWETCSALPCPRVQYARDDDESETEGA